MRGSVVPCDFSKVIGQARTRMFQVQIHCCSLTAPELGWRASGQTPSLELWIFPESITPDSELRVTVRSQAVVAKGFKDVAAGHLGGVTRTHYRARCQWAAAN